MQIKITYQAPSNTDVKLFYYRICYFSIIKNNFEQNTCFCSLDLEHISQENTILNIFLITDVIMDEFFVD